MKVLMAGLGSIARKHIAAIRRIDERAMLFALRSGEGAGGVEGVRDIRSLDELDGVAIDFAVVSNPTCLHAAAIRRLLVLGCPLFIEKPLSDSLDIAGLVEEVRERKLLTYVGCNLRFLDALAFVRNHLSGTGRRLNEVNIYCGSYLPDWRPGTDFRTIYSACGAKGGGAHLDLIHEIDYACWLFGRPSGVRATFRSRSSLGIDAVDYANYCLEYEDFCAAIVLNYYRRDHRRTLELVFDDETWLVDLANNRITAGERVVFESGQRIADTYLSQMEYFCNLVRTGASASCNDMAEAFDILTICLGTDS